MQHCSSQDLLLNCVNVKIHSLGFHALSWSPVHLWIQYTSFFIFIALPFSSVNPSAFPEEVKLVQTTRKLIEPARYQLRCSRSGQHILHWPCRTLAWCYLSKFNSGPAATDPAAASPFMSSSDWNTHSYTRRPDFHAGESPPLWVRQEHEGLAGPYPSAPVPSGPTHSFLILLLCLLSLQQIFQMCVFYLWSRIISCVHLFSFTSFFSVGNHLGAMVHQRWAEHSF